MTALFAQAGTVKDGAYSVSAYDQSTGSAVVRPGPPSRAAVSSA